MGAVLAIPLSVAACTSAASQDAGSTVVDSGPTITAISTEFEATWSPLWLRPADIEAGLGESLHRSGAWILLPAGPPAQTEGALSADVRIYTRVPVGGTGVDIVIRREDQSVFMSLQATTIGEQPICAPPLDDVAYPLWSTEIVRGTTGCSLLVEDAVSYIAWTEGGQDLLAQFGPEVDKSQVATWLDTWEATGSP